MILAADNTLMVDLAEAAGEARITLTLSDAALGPFTIPLADYLSPETNLVAPRVSGIPARGETLAVTPGIWLVDPAAGLSARHQWTRGGQPISGATGPSYTVTAQDEGQLLACRETVGSETVPSGAIAVPEIVVEPVPDPRVILAADNTLMVDLAEAAGEARITLTLSDAA
ncbi:hypothetical protein, partial [Rhodovulum visakhapatnamense]|uniref:hypothetical protein n=1 Tax=Rhodovulum visakhapatnamense TaxID=364297 RepID=UPI001AB03D61